jgi:hypothetical protein
MKKGILTIVALTSIFTTAFAQEENSTITNSEDKLQKLRIGVYAAPTLSFMRPSAAKDGAKTQENGGNKIGFTYGLMADYNFTDNYAIATGLQVNSTGGKINTANPAAVNGEVLKSSFDYTLQFLEIPLAIKLKTDRMGKVTLFGQAGLAMGFNISKKTTYTMTVVDTGSNKNYVVDEKEKITGSIGNIAPITFQMNIGGGMQYAIGKKLDAYVGLFFNNGFAPNITDPTKYTNTPAKFTDGNTRLNNFALRLGFYF